MSKPLFDPTVLALYYKVSPVELVEFENLALGQFTNDGFDIEIDDAGNARMAPTSHYATEAEARNALEPLLRAWEINAAIQFGDGRIRFTFRFKNSTIQDRAFGDGKNLTATLSAQSQLTANAVISEKHERLPTPPSNFALSDEVERIWFRWTAYREGREPIASVAYYCITVLENWIILEQAQLGNSIGKREVRRHAGSRLGFENAVLNDFAELCSEVGDYSQRRKEHAHDDTLKRPFTETEIQWMERILLKVTERIGQYSANSGVIFKSLGKGDI
ncbi:MAG: hypothetical protein AB7V46_07185 [Thermomicrobiales bacterium]